MELTPDQKAADASPADMSADSVAIVRGVTGEQGDARAVLAKGPPEEILPKIVNAA